LGKATMKGVKTASQPMEEDKAASIVKDDRLSMR